jgi:hypothetical protein
MESTWREIVKVRWSGATIFGDGPNAVVVRCAGNKEVHLFPTVEAAMHFRVQLCDNIPCEKKHNIGSLVPFMPAALLKPRGDNLRAFLESTP